MDKKFWIGLVLVFITMGVLSFLIHGVFLSQTYQQKQVTAIMRPEAEMMGMMWIYYVVYLVQSFILTVAFAKMYTGDGMMGGIRFGLSMGLLLATPMAYASYAMYPLPYELALQWFIYGMLEYVAIGIILSFVYGKRPQTMLA